MRRGLYALCFVASTAASGADLIDIYRLAQQADPTYAGARATWAAAQERIRAAGLKRVD